MSLPIGEVTFPIEVVVKRGVDGRELLERLHLPEPEHGPLSSSEGEVAVLDPVVGPATNLLFVLTAKIGHGGPIGSKPVRCDCCRQSVATQRLLREGESQRFIPGFGDVALQDLALVVDRPPEVDHLSIELYVHLVEMAPPVPHASHRLNPLAADVGCKNWPKPVPPQPDRLVAEVDPTFEQQVFNIPQRQREPYVHHHDQADDLRR